jgi:hypothetical protein
MLGADILHPLRCQSSEALAEAGRNACGRSDIGDNRFLTRPELGQELPCRALGHRIPDDLGRMSLTSWADGQQLS